jgi:dTDP-4-amino-4,6-dideoxygalactose transaminase
MLLTTSTEIGYNYRMSNICAGIGRGQMEVLSHTISEEKCITFIKKSSRMDG